jgi:FAD:protein FMN transferase
MTASLRFVAFGGSVCELIAVDGTPADLHTLRDDVDAFERRLTRFDPDSELSAMNASAGRWFEASPLLRALLIAALDVWELTGGLVNAAAHDAVVRAGYDRSFPAVRRAARAPVGAGTAGDAPVAPLPAVLEIGTRSVRLTPGWRIDLGGVGKGWLADRLAERFDNAVLNLGGDLCARGDGPVGAGWAVGLCDGSVATVRDAGVATSGIGCRRWVGGHHLIDPRTGRSAATDVAAVSVVASTALDAEAMAKACAIQGAHDGARWLAALGLTYAVAAAA